jgi:hypothetical protein
MGVLLGSFRKKMKKKLRQTVHPHPTTVPISLGLLWSVRSLSQLALYDKILPEAAGGGSSACRGFCP